MENKNGNEYYNSIEEMREKLNRDILLFGKCEYADLGDGRFCYIPPERWGNFEDVAVLSPKITVMQPKVVNVSNVPREVPSQNVASLGIITDVDLREIDTAREEKQ